jgi:uncharacterized protein
MPTEKFIDVSKLLQSDVGTTKTVKISIQPHLFTDKKMELARPITGSLILTKYQDEIEANFDIETLGKLKCDRCLGKFKKELKVKFFQTYLFGKKPKTSEVNQMLVKPDQTIDIFEPIRQELLLTLPYKNICKPDCQGICPKCGVNLNKKECKCKKIES